MKRLTNLMLAGLLAVTLAACGKTAGIEYPADKPAGQYGQAEGVETAGQAGHGQPAAPETIQTEVQAENELHNREGQQPQIQEGDSAVTGEISFDFETKTVWLNSGYGMPIYGIGTYSLTGDTCVESVTAALNSGIRLIDTAYMYHNDVICCEL